MVFSTIACCVFSYLYAFLRGYEPKVKGAFCQGSFRGNYAYIGLAIVYSAYGEEGLAIGGILLGFLVPLLNLLSIAALIMAQTKQTMSYGAPFFIKQILYNPLIIASLTGILWSFLSWPMPIVVDRAFSIVTGMALPLALISIGATFSLKKFRGDMAVAFLATLNKTVFLPLVTALLLWLFGIRGQEFAVGVLFAGTPTAAAAYIMAQQLQSDAELSGTIIALSTLCSLATYTIILYLLHSVALV
jgi:predicted permease